MSNLETQMVYPLPSIDEEVLAGPQAGAATVNPRPRRFFFAAQVGGDLIIQGIAITAASALVNSVGVHWHSNFTDWLLSELPCRVVLSVGLGGLLGLYRAGIISLMERFRQRAVAAVLFVFIGLLTWRGEGGALDLAIWPLAAGMALVLGSWADHVTKGVFARMPAWGAPTVVVGTGERSRTFARLLLRDPGLGLRPVGFVDDGESRQGLSQPRSQEEDQTARIPTIGGIVGAGTMDRAEVIPSERHRQELAPNTGGLNFPRGRRMVVLEGLDGMASLGMQVHQFDQFVALELGGRPRLWDDRQKRVLDLAVALPLAVLTAPIVGLLAVLIRIADPGPAFYSQVRVGRHGKPIRVLKLRTMYQDAERRLDRVLAGDLALREQWQRFFKLPEDPRILPRVGNFLRRTSLDELPQLFNIIRGDMSLVGPRPFPSYHTEAFDSEFQTLRTTVLPGLTGLWQISSRSNGDLSTQKAQDCFYIHNRCLWLDLYILVATLPAVLTARGAK